MFGYLIKRGLKIDLMCIKWRRKCEYRLVVWDMLLDHIRPLYVEIYKRSDREKKVG